MAFLTPKEIITKVKNGKLQAVEKKENIDKKSKAILTALFGETIPTALNAWQNEFSYLAPGAKIIGFYDGNLLIEVVSNTHLHAIILSKKRIIEKINQYFGNSKPIKGLKCHLK
ncbi:MAG: DUF721 domain-containing protein [Endomicrobiales bacterium]|nr:DUF721 domain-containing protein [Endomicrobiales bacterium]